MKNIQSLSTAELRKLETAFSKPSNLSESIMLRGIQAELSEVQDNIDRSCFPAAYRDAGDETDSEDYELAGVESKVSEIIGAP